MVEALHSFETSVGTRDSRRNIPEDGILHSDRHEKLKSYKYFSSPLKSVFIITLGVDSGYSYITYSCIRAPLNYDQRKKDWTKETKEGKQIGGE
jgi:hypothetical protein